MLSTEKVQAAGSSKFLGGITARVTPVPIPNTEVKPRRADDTALETTRERRSPPGLKQGKGLREIGALFILYSGLTKQKR